MSVQRCFLAPAAVAGRLLSGVFRECICGHGSEKAGGQRCAGDPREDASHLVTFRLFLWVGSCVQSLGFSEPVVDALADIVVHMSTSEGMSADDRDRHLNFFLTLGSHPTRIAIIDVVKARGVCTEKELVEHLVAVGDLAPQAGPNIGRVHLSSLVEAGLLRREFTAAGEVGFDEGPELGSGLDWTAVPRDDVELLGAVQEFERVAVERRIHRQRWWSARRWTDVSEEWSTAAIGWDNVVRCRQDELRSLEDELKGVLRRWEERVRDRRSEDGTEGEAACFRTIAVFPWGPMG